MLGHWTWQVAVKHVGSQFHDESSQLHDEKNRLGSSAPRYPLIFALLFVQMYDRTEKALDAQTTRHNMLCLALCKDRIAVWRMRPCGESHEYGPVDFQWEEENEGYQVRVPE